jgi:RNA polymerase sigma-70 factor (ECF subfamily)
MGGLASVTRLTSLHDQELAALAAAGDRRAFGELARRHNAAVRGLLMRMGADPATADDLAQDAFLAAFGRIADFRGEGSFAGWIKKIAARLYLKRWRKQRPLVDESEAMEMLAGSEGETAQRIDLDEALQSLSPAERVCVALCYGAGFSHSEAAEATGAPLGTVKSHVKRGLDKLRSRLAPSTGSAGERVHV